MRRAFAIPALALAACLSLAPAAHAAYDPLGSGITKLTLDKRFARFLDDGGVKLTSKQGARRRGNTYLLPISGGQIDPTTGKGEAESEGVLVFQNERKQVPLREIRVKTNHQPLIAKVGGGQLKLASSPTVSSARSGFGTRFSAVELKLTSKLATRLNKKLRPEAPFSASQLIGTLTANAQPALVAIEDTGRASLALDPAFLQKLDSRFVSLNPISPAERAEGTFTFPVAVGGQVAPNGSAGALRTGGALEFLQLGAGQVFWQELWLDLAIHSASAEVDIEPTPAFPGKIGRVDILGVGAAVFASDPQARTISVAGAALTLSAGEAGRLNEAFARGEPPVFAAGEAVGSLSFTAQAQ